MTKRLPCPPAPGPLEDYAAQFDALFARLAQRRGLRAYLQGLLLPRERSKTLTALAGAEPIVGAQHAAVQELQWFLSESSWDHEQVNQRRLALLLGDPATRPHERGVLVIDDTGDRKAGTKTAHVARQYLGSVGTTDNSNRGGDQPVGRRARLLASARHPVHAGVAAAQGQDRPRLPDQTTAGRRARRGCTPGWHRLSRRGRRLLLR